MPTLRKLRKEDHKFEDSVGYIKTNYQENKNYFELERTKNSNWFK